MSKKVFSGKEVIKILCKEFDFHFVSQKGSHVKLAKKIGVKQIITVVPLHKELAPGTFRGALDLAKVEIKDFLKKAG
jgi:predicted RNA binding protein YcfA (HicA-like mRNA interferase family)